MPAWTLSSSSRCGFRLPSRSQKAPNSTRAGWLRNPRYEISPHGPRCMARMARSTQRASHCSFAVGPPAVAQFSETNKILSVPFPSHCCRVGMLD